MSEKRLKQFITDYPDRPSVKAGECRTMAEEIVHLRDRRDALVSYIKSTLESGIAGDNDVAIDLLGDIVFLLDLPDDVLDGIYG